MTAAATAATNTAAGGPSWPAVPAPVRDLFKRFPLRVHAAEPLPARASPAAARARRPRLFVAGAGRAGGDDGDDAPPSSDPACLRWQTYLRIAGVDVDIVPSTHHASPDGALPFLLPAASNPRPAEPLTGRAIARYARARARAAHPLSGDADADDEDYADAARRRAYLALVTHSLRPAWLFALYLDPTGPDLPAPPRGPFASAAPLAAAAAAVLADADAALAALSALLAADAWFFAAPAPGLFDAHVFAYTHLILCRTPAAGRHGRALRAALERFANLVAHRDALFRRCWGRRPD